MPTYKTPDVYIEEIPVFPPSVAEVGTAIPAFIGYTEKAKKTADNDLRLKPIKIYSFAEFEQYFGAPVLQQITVALTADPLEPTGFKSVYTLGTTRIAPPTPIPTPTPTATPTSTATPTATATDSDTDGHGDSDTRADAYCDAVARPGQRRNAGYRRSISSIGRSSCTSTTAAASATSCRSAATTTRSPWEDTTGLQAGLEKVALEDEPTLLVIPEAARLTFADYKQLAQEMLTSAAS